MAMTKAELPIPLLTYISAFGTDPQKFIDDRMLLEGGFEPRGAPGHTDPDLAGQVVRAYDCIPS